MKSTVQPPRFLLTGDNDEPPDSWAEARRRVIQETRSFFIHRLRDEGHQVLQEELTALLRDKNETEGQARGLDNQIRYNRLLIALCVSRARERPLAEWNPSVDALLNAEPDAELDDDAFEAVLDAEREGWSHVPGDSGGWTDARDQDVVDTLVLSPPDALLRARGIDPTKIFQDRRLELIATDTWDKVIQSLRDTAAFLVHLHEETCQEAKLLRFRAAVLEDVLKDHRAGSLNEKSKGPGRWTPSAGQVLR